MPAFRDAFSAGRRGIPIVRTFNEAKKVTEKKYEQQVLTPKDGKPLGIAVVWKIEAQPDRSEIPVYIMVTTPPNTLIATITERMPTVLPEAHWEKWLGAEPATQDQLKGMLKAFEGEWNMGPQKPTKPPKPSKPEGPKQPTFF